MPRRALAALAAALVTLAGLSAGTASVGALEPAALAAAPAVAATPPTDPDASSDAAEDNPFVPEGKDLSECVSAVPKPGCGSKARGGWRQALVFVVVCAGLAFLGWQIVRTVRRNRRLVEGTDDEAREQPAGGRRGP